MNKLNKIDYDLVTALGERFGLPLHVIFKSRIKENYISFMEAGKQHYPFLRISYAVKSNPCRGAIRTVAELKSGVDAVSEYEMQTALEEGVSGNKIVCNGNAKTDRYLQLAADSGAYVALDCIDEIDRLDAIAAKVGKTAPVLIRVVGMPLEGLTSQDQSTATNWTKFGFHIDEFDAVFNRIKAKNALKFAGISAHIGTQICDETGYERLMQHLLKLMDHCRDDLSVPVEAIDLGGGFPVNYMTKDDWDDFNARLKKQLAGEAPTDEWVTWENIPMGYAYLQGRRPAVNDKWIGKAYWTEYAGSDMLERLLTKVHYKGKPLNRYLNENGSPLIIAEPGRGIVGTAGITLAEVAWVKKVMGNYVVSLDIGIVNQGTNLITPDIFPAEILPKKDKEKPIEAFLAGRLCFTGDLVSKVKLKLNRLPQRGDKIVLHHTGSYCADHFASNSCGFMRPAKVAVAENGRIEIWRKADRFEDVFAEVDETEL